MAPNEHRRQCVHSVDAHLVVADSHGDGGRSRRGVCATGEAVGRSNNREPDHNRAHGIHGLGALPTGLR
jgi:hypothetical protein